jgi:hypothetical protein
MTSMSSAPATPGGSGGPKTREAGSGVRGTSGGTPTSPPSMDFTFPSRTLLKPLTSLFDGPLKALPGAANIFHRPVCPSQDDAADYYTVILHPMDLGTIRDRISMGWYFEAYKRNPKEFSVEPVHQLLETSTSTPTQRSSSIVEGLIPQPLTVGLRRDFLLMRENCEKYNGLDHRYSEMARGIERFAVQQLLPLAVEVDEKVFGKWQTFGSQNKLSLRSTISTPPRTPKGCEILREEQPPLALSLDEKGSKKHRGAKREREADATCLPDALPTQSSTMEIGEPIIAVKEEPKETEEKPSADAVVGIEFVAKKRPTTVVDRLQRIQTHLEKLAEGTSRERLHPQKAEPGSASTMSLNESEKELLNVVRILKRHLTPKQYQEVVVRNLTTPNHESDANTPTVLVRLSALPERAVKALEALVHTR